MQIPVQITFRDMEPSPAIEERVRERAAKLERFYDRITSCRVLVEEPHLHQHKGKLFHVRIDVTVPGGELVANRSHDDNHAHEDVYVAIRDAFRAIERQLEEHAQKKKGRVKTHNRPEFGDMA